MTDIAAALRASKYAVVFSGAGISTSAGLPDYRGENGVRSRKRGRSAVSVPRLSELSPTVAHRCVAELARRGIVRFVITQNVDGLHGVSGLEPGALCELHGNATQAVCDTCEEVIAAAALPEGEYWKLCPRPECPSAARPLERRLRAKTRHGNGRLSRHVVPFDGEVDVEEAVEHASQADFALVLGTSLRVQPFAGLVELAVEENDAKLCIVNRDPTTPAFDRAAEACGMRSFEDCDAVMLQVTRQILGDDAWEPSECPSPPDAFGTAAEEDGCLINCLAGSS